MVRRCGLKCSPLSSQCVDSFFVFFFFQKAALKKVPAAQVYINAPVPILYCFRSNNLPSAWQMLYINSFGKTLSFIR